jgi:predicted RNA binding protein YcfA (HicA-like mRNA interferase family)
MPRRIGELEKELKSNGFKCKEGKGSHRKWRHPSGTITVVISGKKGEDAKYYQEAQLKEAIQEIRNS